MKVVNELHRPTIITAQEVIAVAGITDGIDLKRISNSIIVAEERFLRQTLGFAFYEALLAEKNTLVTDINKSALQTAMNSEWSTNLTLSNGQVINSADFLSVNNKALWNMQLYSLAAECVMFVAFPENYTDFTSSGIVHNAPKFDAVGNSKTNTPELATIKWQMDKMITGRIGPLQDSLHQYICMNKDKYPLYTKKCECADDVKGFVGSSNVLTDVYGDDDSKIDCPC